MRLKWKYFAKYIEIGKWKWYFSDMLTGYVVEQQNKEGLAHIAGLFLFARIASYIPFCHC